MRLSPQAAVLFALCIPIRSKVRGEGREIVPKMNPEIKGKWLTALRSGDYVQGKGFLCGVKGDGSKDYCCLGVLTDLYIQEMGLEWKHGISYLHFDGQAVMLPLSVMNWSGVSDTGLFYDEEGEMGDLADINDTSDNFDKVIQIIEEKF